MNKDKLQRAIINKIVESIDIPDSSYQLAEKRYQDISEWLCNSEHSNCADYNPHVFPQGSFRLGTVIRPINGNDQYDLDLTCNLKEGLSKAGVTQEFIKQLIGRDLEKYRKARKIQEPLEEKHRCWSLEYQDDIRFHLDIVPCIPEEENLITSLQNRMLKFVHDAKLVRSIADLAVSITDNRDQYYKVISLEWLISNPQGYALWFESRMKLAQDVLENRRLEAEVSHIDTLPTYQWKTPLQRSVQILKRHRDVMFKDKPDSKPVSIIVTTLAGHSYDGESDIFEALNSILYRMKNYVRNRKPRISNPVNPEEDFADHWDTEKGRHLRLEENFHRWIDQVQTDLDLLGQADVDFLANQSRDKFNVQIPHDEIRDILGPGSTKFYPKRVNIATPAKPWSH